MDAAAAYDIGGFGDFRLNQVGHRFFKKVVERGHLIIRRLASCRSEQVQFERFLWNDRVSTQKMLESSQQNVRRLIVDHKIKHVALIQDTSQCCYRYRKNEIRGMGVIQNDDGPGFFLHPVLALDVEDGFALGLTACKFWSRDPGRVKESRQTAPKKKPLEKESYKWTKAIADSRECVQSADRVTVIADREADLFSMLVDVPDEKIDVLIRSNCKRMVRSFGDRSKPQMLCSLMETYPVVDTRVMELAHKSLIHHRDKMTVRQQRKEAPNGRKARSVRLALKYQHVELIRPKTAGLKDYPSICSAWCVQVEEVDQTSEDTPISWTLVTTRPIENIDQAWEVVELYKKRWLIEVMFKTSKKGGYHIEQIEAVKVETIHKLCFISLLASVKVLQLTMCRDDIVRRQANLVFSENEIKVLKALNEKYQGKTIKQKNPFESNTLAWAHWILGRAGGWMGYVDSEGPAGTTAIKHGLDRLQQTIEALFFLKDVCIS